MSIERYPVEVQSFNAESAPMAKDLRGILPIYKSIKLVRAVKIERIVSCAPKTPGCMRSQVLVPENKAIQPFKVTIRYSQKHDPQAGGYFVVYADGYESYSPAGAFEDSYIRMIEQAPAPSASTCTMPEVDCSP